MRANTSEIAVVFDSMQRARRTLARSPSGTHIGACELMPHLKQVGDQSTNCTPLRERICVIARDVSWGATSPRYMRQHAMYLPWRGSHLAKAASGSKAYEV